MNWLDPNPLIRGDLRTAIKDLRTTRLSLRDSLALCRPLRAAELIEVFAIAPQTITTAGSRMP